MARQEDQNMGTAVDHRNMLGRCPVNKEFTVLRMIRCIAKRRRHPRDDGIAIDNSDYRVDDEVPALAPQRSLL
jgi:hypothetical protein